MMKTENIIPVLMDTKTACRFIGVGISLFKQLDADGSIPESVRLHSRKLYPTTHLKLWAENGCPARTSEKWQEILDNLPLSRQTPAVRKAGASSSSEGKL